MKYVLISSLIALLAGSLMNKTVYSTYINQHATGWHFYEDRVQVEETEGTKEKPSVPPSYSSPRPMTPTEILNAMKAELTHRLHRAIVTPNPENIRSYQALQKMMLDRAEQFGTEWMKVVMTHPELDYTVNHPTTQVGRHLYHDEHKKLITRKIETLSKTHGLFFFFKGDCAYCHQFAPIVKRFAETYGLTIMAISIDGSTLPEFPNAIQDNGAASRLNVTLYPTLLAVQPKTGRILPISYGLSTHDQMEERIRLLLKENNMENHP